MATAFYILSNGGSNTKWILRSIWTYGVGQSLFATGMFVAGTFGMSRKTYGAQHQFENLGQTVGFLIMAVGGLIALAGGLFFAFAIYPYLKKEIQPVTNEQQ
jgi:heme/copper-type cytochrome/quinol oxidase subunit 1